MNPAGRPSGGERPGGPARPTLRPTSVATLVLAFVVAGVLGWLFIRTYFAQIPNLTLAAGLTLAALAIAEFAAAHNTRAKIERRRGYGRINPLLVARYAVLAKASSLAGAIFAGGYGGIAAWSLMERGVLRVAAANLGPAVAGLVGGLALTCGGLLLERACRVPPPPDDKDNEGGSSTTRR